MVRCLAFAVVSLLAVGTADAGELSSAPLRGSRVDAVGPSYPVFESQPIYSHPRGYDIAPPSYAPPSYASTAVQPVAAMAMRGYAFEAGTRYWYSSGKLAKDLFDDPRSSNALNSRLTYDGLTAHAFEAFGRIDLPSGLFLKGFAGLAGLRQGTLNDEDFPPGIDPYSSTMSEQSGGKLSYAAIDFGYAFVTQSRAKVSVFGGYGYVGEKVNAYGCRQIATSAICDPAIASNVLGISEDANWHLLRVGLAADYQIMDRLTLSAEAAWVPWAQVNSRDTHWLRTGTTIGSFAGPIPQTAQGSGVQLEALLAYQVWDCFNIGVGGRYWRFDAPRGSGDLEQTIVGWTNPMSQPMTFTSERYGMFVQGSYKFSAM
jgi:outer membrane protease